MEVIKHVMSVCHGRAAQAAAALAKSISGSPTMAAVFLAGSCKFLLLDERNIHTASRAAG